MAGGGRHWHAELRRVGGKASVLEKSRLGLVVVLGSVGSRRQTGMGADRLVKKVVDKLVVASSGVLRK